jgi:hypothetical protein
MGGTVRRRRVLWRPAAVTREGVSGFHHSHPSGQLCAYKVESYVPLRVRPVKLRDSLYLLIPVDIARLLGVASSSDFQLSLNENQESVRLVYELKKEDAQPSDDKKG